MIVRITVLGGLSTLDIYTMGFAGWKASEFFEALRKNNIRHLIDVRINNTTQLAGYTKRDDLNYFLQAILGITYRHEPLLAPTENLLKEYRQRDISWEEYSARFLELMKARQIEDVLEEATFDVPTVLLCSEHTQEYCHRRLVVEYLNEQWGDVISLPI